MNCTTYFTVAKTKALISCAATVQLICASVFAYAKSRFSHDAAHISLDDGNGSHKYVQQIRRQLPHLGLL